MEKFLNDPNNFPGYFTKENAFPILEAYVHKDVYDLFSPHDTTGFTADFRNTKAAIYGNFISEFKMDLASFRSFPGCLQKFGANSRSYRSNVRKFAVGKEGTDVDSYVYKSDLFAIMAQSLPMAGLMSYGEYVVEAVEYYCAIYLRHKEAELLKGVNELVKFDEAVFIRFHQDLVAQATKKIDEKMSKLTYSNFRKAMKKAYHTVDKSLGPIVDKWMTHVETNLSFSVHKCAYLWIQQYVTVFLTKSEAFIKQQKEWFTLNQKYEKLRLFRNGETFFIMAKELHAEMRRSNYNGGEFERELHAEKDILHTLTWKEAERKWNTFVTNAPPLAQIVKVHYECTRTKHRAIFIPYCGNKYCILASDALLELMRAWFSVKGILQKVTDQYRQLFIQSFFYKLYDFEPKFFSMDRPMFLDVNRVDSINTWMETEMNGHFGPLLKSCREITPCTGTITLDDVVDRLKQTNIIYNFPIIQNFHKIVYLSHLKKRKNVLSLCDMYGIYEQCQLLVFCATMSSIRQLLECHGQHKMYPTDCIEYERLLLDSRQKLNKLHETDVDGWEADQARAADIARQVAEAKAKRVAQHLGLPPPGPKKIQSGNDEISDAARFHGLGYITLENIIPVLRYYCEESVAVLFKSGECEIEGDYHNSRIAYYADSTEDLYVQLDKFRGFPGCLEHCGFESRTYRKKCVKYTFTPKNKGTPTDFWYKQEAYLLLFDQLYRNELDRQGFFTNAFIEFFCNIYLRYKEIQMLEHCNEFTKDIDMKVFERFRHHLSNCFDEEEANEMKEVTLANTATALKKVLRNHFRPRHEGSIANFVDETMKLLQSVVNIKTYQKDYVTIVHHSTIFVREAEAFINDNLRWFKKADKWEVIPRLFKHGNTKGFFIVSELMTALDRMKKRVPLMKEMHFRDQLSTISFDKAQLLVFNDYCNFEFLDFPVVPTEIIRTKHRVVPIPYDRKRHCIPVLDALTEMLRKWIMRGIFQNLPAAKTHQFKKLFFDELAKLEPKFKLYDPKTLSESSMEKYEEKCLTAPVLIDVGWVMKLEQKLEVNINRAFGDIMAASVDVVPNESDQFTYEDLEKRARDMKLFVTMPTLRLALKTVYDNFKRPGMVTTNDIYEMLEHAQLLQIFSFSLPSFKYGFEFNTFGVPAYPFTYDRYEARTNIMAPPPLQ